MGDFVWQYDDGDRIQDLGEAGIEGVTVPLHDNSNNFVASTTTASDWIFPFNFIGLGTSYLVFGISTNASGITFYAGFILSCSLSQSDGGYQQKIRNIINSDLTTILQFLFDRTPFSQGQGLVPVSE
ncbi:MAG: hypothetical protein ACI8YQ_001352 [Polaribacter sp.]|jgi:hypothetical protein